MKCELMVLCVLAVSRACFSGLVELHPMPVSECADTEVSTNLVFNGNRDLREVEIGMRLEGCPSNCLQVAFGRDANADGQLNPGETEAMFGWRNGRMFIENFLCGERWEESAPGDSLVRALKIELMLMRGGIVKGFSAASETGEAVFPSFAANVPTWSYRPEWNLMRVTRRGPGIPVEWFTCNSMSRFFQLIVR